MAHPKKHIGILLATLLLLALQTFASGQDASELSDAELLEAIDEARFLSTRFVSETMEIHAKRADSDVQTATVTLSYASLDSDTSSVRIEFVAPEVNAGQIFLILENESVMLCTPSLEMPLLLSGGSDVFGDSTVSTTAGIQLAGQYRIMSRVEETFHDALALRLNLGATTPNAAYPSASIWIVPTTLQPLQLTLYALSGDALSRITFDEFGLLEDDQYLIRQTIENLLLEGYATTLTITGISTDPFPEDLLNPDAFCRTDGS